MENTAIIKKPLCQLTIENPIFTDFLNSFSIDPNENKSFIELTETLPLSFWEENSTSKDEITKLLIDFANGLNSAETTEHIESLEVVAGTNKTGEKENCNLMLRPGEITCIVGPTGSGKSRLLADIEWLANADTPTKRKVFINGKIADDQTLNSFGGKLIAQITQNMNFVLDMNVQDFLMLHAQSRFLNNAEATVNEVIELANNLSGESFTPETPVTFLSGGQSRALMIADVACIGQAPIVLIDEIENAGVDKKKALELLVQQDKIVLMATHDPLLILLADKRIVIKNGGMDKIITTSATEKKYYAELEELDHAMQKAKDFFRLGNQLTTNNPIT